MGDGKINCGPLTMVMHKSNWKLRFSWTSHKWTYGIHDQFGQCNWRIPYMYKLYQSKFRMLLLVTGISLYKIFILFIHV